MTVALILLAFVIICFLEIPGMIQQKYWRELIIFSVFLLPGLVLSILQGLGTPIYSPIKVITYLVNMVLSVFS